MEGSESCSANEQVDPCSNEEEGREQHQVMVRKLPLDMQLSELFDYMCLSAK